MFLFLPQNQFANELILFASSKFAYISSRKFSTNNTSANSLVISTYLDNSFVGSVCSVASIHLDFFFCSQTCSVDRLLTQFDNKTTRSMSYRRMSQRNRTQSFKEYFYILNTRHVTSANTNKSLTNITSPLGACLCFHQVDLDTDMAD